MTNAEVAVFLAAMRGLDSRVAVDDAAVLAWASVLDPDCPLEFARGFFVTWFRDHDRLPMPSNVNAAWRQARWLDRVGADRVLPGGSEGRLSAAEARAIWTAAAAETVENGGFPEVP